MKLNSLAGKIIYSDKIQKDIFDGIYETERLCIADGWSKNALECDINKNNTYYTAAFFNNEVVGFCGITYVCGEAEITNIAVKPQYRGNGIAQNLLNCIFKFCSLNNINAIYLEVREHNKPALNLYTKSGFLKIGTRKNYYTDTSESAINMKKSIN